MQGCAGNLAAAGTVSDDGRVAMRIRVPLLGNQGIVVELLIDLLDEIASASDYGGFVDETRVEISFPTHSDRRVVIEAHQRWLASLPKVSIEREKRRALVAFTSALDGAALALPGDVAPALILLRHLDALATECIEALRRLGAKRVKPFDVGRMVSDIIAGLHALPREPAAFAGAALRARARREERDAAVSVVERTVVATLDEGAFWALVDRIDRAALEHGDAESAVVPVVRALSGKSEPFIRGFANCLAEKLYAVDGEQFALAGQTGRWDGSPDAFLYARCAAVARGRAFYESVLADPVRMPVEEDCEPLLCVAEQAYEKKTGDSFDFDATPSYETFSNSGAWAERPR